MALIKPRTAAKTSVRTGGVKFAYKARAPETVRERASAAIGGRDSYFPQDIPFFTPREGENTVRILPPPPEAADEWRHYGVTLAVHYSIGADQSAYLCVNKMKDEFCPLCAARDAANQAGEEALADDLRPGFRVAIYVIDRSQEGKGPQLWNMPAGLDKDIVKLLIDPGDGSVLPVDDPNDGYDLTFSREGTGLTTKYKGARFARKPSPLADDEATAEAWLSYIVEHRIDHALVYHDPDYIAKVFDGQAPAKSEGKEAAAKPAVKAAAKPAGRAATTPAATKPAIRPRAAPAAAPPPADPDEPTGELPTWEQLCELDEDALALLIEEQQLEVPEEGFDSIEALQSWVAESIGVHIDEKPTASEAPPATQAAAKPSWRDRLKNTGGK